MLVEPLLMSDQDIDLSWRARSTRQNDVVLYRDMASLVQFCNKLFKAPQSVIELAMFIIDYQP